MIFKETVSKTHDKKIARKGFVFLVATAEDGMKKYTQYLQVPDNITGEERKILFAQLWLDMKPRVQKSQGDRAPKEHRPLTKKIIAYAILGAIVVLIILSLL